MTRPRMGPPSERAGKAEGTTPSSFVRELLARELGTTKGDTSVLERTRRW